MTLDHFTIRTTDLPASRQFFETFFDLVERPRPRAICHIPGYWLYADDEPIVHLIGSRGAGYDRAANAIDHVALRIDDYADFRARLDNAGTAYSTMELPELHERRLFLHAPGGPMIEAVYRSAQIHSQPTHDSTSTPATENTRVAESVGSGVMGEAA